MSYPRTIRNFNAFQDGIDYFGLVTAGTLPSLKMKTAAHRGAGMDAPMAMDLGMEALQVQLTFSEWREEIVESYGNRVPLVLRPAAMGEEDFSADTWIYTLRSRTAGFDWDELKAGEPSMMKLTGEVDRFKVEKNGRVLVDIDVENGKRVIGGVDQLAELRAAMGR